MDTLTKDQSQKSKPMTWTDLDSTISSLVSEAGPTPSNSQDGPAIERSGQDLVHVSHSRQRVLDGEQMTLDIYGPNSPASLASGNLQRSLESKLVARMDLDGSPEYVLTWKRWDMPSGPPICALRASARRTGGRGFSGWATPTAKDEARGNAPARPQDTGIPLSQMVVTGHGTPTSRDHKSESTPNQARAMETNSRLSAEAMLAGYPTPNAMDGGQTSRGGDRKGELLIGGLVRGLNTDSSNTPTAKSAGYRLNLRFSLWLMGYNPDVWWGSRVQETLSSRKPRRNL